MSLLCYYLSYYLVYCKASSSSYSIIRPCYTILSYRGSNTRTLTTEGLQLKITSWACSLPTPSTVLDPVSHVSLITFQKGICKFTTTHPLPRYIPHSSLSPSCLPSFLLSLHVPFLKLFQRFSLIHDGNQLQMIK